MLLLGERQGVSSSNSKEAGSIWDGAYWSLGIFYVVCRQGLSFVCFGGWLYEIGHLGRVGEGGNLRHILGKYSYPGWISDHGLSFTSRELGEFVIMKGIRHVLNAFTTLRANGQVLKVGVELKFWPLVLRRTESESTWHWLRVLLIQYFLLSTRKSLNSSLSGKGMKES